MDDLFHVVKKVIRVVLLLFLFLCGLAAGWYAKAAQGLSYLTEDADAPTLSRSAYRC